MFPLCAPDPWLTQTTAFPCYRVTRGWGESSFRDEIGRVAGKEGKSFFYAKLPTHDVAGGTYLSRSGFTLVDTNVVLDLKDGVFPTNPVVIVGEAQADQFKLLQDIAETCFQYSRFHLDPLFPDKLANLIKRRWVENYCNHLRGSALYAARIGNAVVGFLAVLVVGEPHNRTAFIDLLGVTPEYQRHGVGVALVRHFVDCWAGQVERLSVGTQIANATSLKFYQRCGFEIAESSYVFHGHFFEGVPVS